MRHLIAPVPWIGADPTTSGPLNAYALVLPLWLGAPVSYATARAVGLLCWVGALGFGFLTLREQLSSRVARLAVLPAATFLCAAAAGDYVHYSSEHVPVLLLSVALFFGVRGLAREARFSLAWAGLALGAVPFAKLQAGPIALTLGLLLLGAIAWRSRDLRACWRPMLVLGLAALALPAALLGWVAAHGGLGDFWLFYIASGLDYPSRRLPVDAFVRMVAWGNFFPFQLVTGLVLLAGLVSALPPFRRRAVSVPLAAAAAAFLAASLAAVFIPGRGFPHYLLLLVVPLSLLTALALHNLPWQGASRARNGALAGGVVALAFGLQLLLNPLPITWYDPRPRAPRGASPELVSTLRNLAEPGDTLAIWGWMPQYHVDSGLPPATRHAIAYFAISPGPNRERYRETFLADLLASRPLLVLEAVGPGNFHFEDRDVQGVDSFPALRAFLDAHYCELSGRRAQRLFLREDARDRAGRLGSSRCAPRPA
jgi:hypothetical protein